MTIIIISFVV